MSANTGAARIDTFSFSYPSSTAFTLNQAAAPTPPTLTSISPNTGAQGSSVPVTLTGTNFIAGAAVSVGNAGVSVSSVNVVSSTQITATFAISSSASLGSATVSVNEVGGSVSVLHAFTITPGVPTLTSISPNSGAQGTSVPVTLTGTNFIAGATVNVSTTGVTVSNVNLISATQIIANLAISSNAPNGSGTVTVTTSGGTSSGVTFSVIGTPPTISSVVPSSGAAGTSVPVTVSGTNFIPGGILLFSVCNSGVSVSSVNVVSTTQITATFIIASGESVGPCNFEVYDSAGFSNLASFTVTASPPTLTSISPNSGAQGTSVPVTLTGSNFISGASVSVSTPGVTVTSVTVASATQINATFAIAPTAANGSGSVTVTTSGGTSSGVTFSVNAAPPTLTSISPSNGDSGTSVLVTLSGSNFISGATVNVNNSGVSVTNVSIVSLTQITATFVIASNAIAGPANVNVTTSGGTTGHVSFSIIAGAPTLSSINPNSGAAGTSVPVTLSGTNFITGATVSVSNAAVSVSSVNLVSATQITATFVIGSSASLGNASVTVTTSAGTTAPFSFNVVTGAPTVTSVSPSSGAPGASVSVTLSGTNFNSGATVNVNNAGVSVSNVNVVSATQITATFTITSSASPGPFSVTVATSAGTSNPANFTVNLPRPTLNSVIPNGGVQGASVPVTLTGTSFTSGAQINVNNASVTVSNVNIVNATQITATFAIGSNAAPGPFNVTVTTSAGTSAPVSFNVIAGLPTLISISPSSGAPGLNVPVTLTGTNFISGATVNVSGSGVSVSNLNVVSVTQITATFAIVSSASAGSFNVTVTTPSGMTGPVSFTIKAAPALTVSPGSLSFGVQAGNPAPTPQSISVFTNSGTASFTASASGGSWLSVSPGSGQTPGSVLVSVNPSGLTAGVANGQITITGQNTVPGTITVPVTLTVTAVTPAQLGVSPQQVGLSYVQGASADQRALAVSNTGGGTLSFTAQAQTFSCGGWLTLISNSGSATTAAPGVISFAVNPGGLPAGTCAGQITVSAGASQSQIVPVTMVVTGQSESMVLSQTGLDFQMAQGAAPSSQTFGIVNTGLGSMNWSIQSSLLSGSGWLSATPGSGVSVGGASSASLVTVTVNPQGLAAGRYYGTVQVTAPGAGNSPKSVTVSLTVLPSGTFPPPQATPAGLILVGQAGSATSSSQSVTLMNQSNASLSYSSTVVTQDGQSWLTQTLGSGTIAVNGTAQMSLQANLILLGAGLWNGTLRVAFGDGTVQTVDVVLLIVSGSTTNSTAAKSMPVAAQAASAGTCNPSKDLVVVFQKPAAGFPGTAGTSLALDILAADCAGNPVTSNASGDVVIQDQNSKLLADPILTHQGNGVWTATWAPATQDSSVSLTARMNKYAGGTAGTLSGQTTITGGVQAGGASALGVVATVQNGASYQGMNQITPGAWVVLKGSQLATGTAVQQSIPYNTGLGGTQVTMQGQPIPLYYVSQNQVNALIPSGQIAGTPQLMVTRSDGTPSVGIDVLVTDLEPGIFSVDSSGTGQGSIQIANTGFIAGPTSSSPPAQPVQRGQYISIYCTGLGPVTNPPADGTPASGTTLSSTQATTTATIGGTPAPVIFSGLAPGLVGLYVVNAQVPTAVTPGDAVPVFITVGGLTSNTVTMAVQ